MSLQPHHDYELQCHTTPTLYVEPAVPALYCALPGKVCDCYYNYVESVEKKSEEDRGKLNVLG